MAERMEKKRTSDLTFASRLAERFSLGLCKHLDVDGYMWLNVQNSVNDIRVQMGSLHTHRGKNFFGAITGSGFCDSRDCYNFVHLIPKVGPCIQTRQ